MLSRQLVNFGSNRKKAAKSDARVWTFSFHQPDVHHERVLAAIRSSTIHCPEKVTSGAITKSKTRRVIAPLPRSHVADLPDPER
jgi:hypothetical protein